MSDDPYAEVPPPFPTDGPQKPVNWTKLEAVGHAVLPRGTDDGYELGPDELEPAVDLISEAIELADAETVDGVLEIAAGER